MPQDPEQKLSGTLSLLLVSEETPQGEGQKEGLRGVPPGRGGPEEADHKRAVAVCWALGTCSPDGAWRKVMSVSDIHSQELLGLPVSLPTFQFSQGSGHSQGIKGWCPPPCWRGELRRGHCAPCCAAGARPMCILQRAESVRREDTVRTVLAAEEVWFLATELVEEAQERTTQAHARESLQCPGTQARDDLSGPRFPPW